MAAPLPGQIKPMVGVYYFPGWHIKPPIKPLCPGGPPAEVGEWRYAVMKAAKPRPLCGFYDESDPRLWDYYIDWMTGHGIDFVAFDWYYNAGQQFLYEALDRGLLQAAKCDQVKFCLHWCNHGGLWWQKPMDQSKPALVEMIDEVCHRYFHRPNYLRIDRKPVFMIYDIDALLGFGGRDGVKESLKAMRAVAKEHGFGDLYVVAVYSAASSAYIKMLKDLGFDAFCAYTYSWMRAPRVAWHSKSYPYGEIVDMAAADLYPFLERMGKLHGIPYWPTTFSGWDDRPRAGLENAIVLTDNTPAQFGRLFKGALGHVNAASPVVMVEAWNEWGEGANIEPSKEHGFGYLKEIASAVGIKPGIERTPSPAEIKSWSILTDEELRIARANESKPWPVKETSWIKLGESRAAPDVKMPVVFDLSAGGVPTEELTLNGVEIVERGKEGAVCSTTSGDPSVILPKMEVPARQVKRIVIGCRLLDKPSANQPAPVLELYWSTGRIPEFTPYCSVKLPLSPDGEVTIHTDEIMTWTSGGTPVTRIRIDLGDAPGNRFLVRRVVAAGD